MSAAAAPSAKEVQEEEVAALHLTFGDDFYLEKPVWGSASFSIAICALPQNLGAELHFTYVKTYPRAVPVIEIKPPRSKKQHSVPAAEFPKIKSVLTKEADRLVRDGIDGPFVFQLVEMARDFLYEYAASKPTKPALGRMEVDLRKDAKLFPPAPRPLVPLLRSTSDGPFTAPSTPRPPPTMDQKIEDPRIARRGGRYLLDFEELERLGKGGFGVVMKARNRLDGMIYAVKQIKLPKNNDEAMRKTRNEVTTLARLIHPNIVRYFMSWLEESAAKQGDAADSSDEEDEFSSSSAEDGFSMSASLLRPPSAFSNYDDSAEGFSSSSSSSSSDDDNDNDGDEDSNSEEDSSPRHAARGGFLTLFIVMEYVPRTLRSMIDQGELFGNEERCFAIIREVLEALASIHELLVVHHDIKPDNLLIDQAGRVKLGDFGLAVIRNKRGGESAEEVGGTALYRAPEIGTAKQWDEKCDIFSLGVVVVEMFLKPMSTAMERIVTLSALKNRPIELPARLPVSVHPLALLLLQPDPRKRPSASQAYSKAIPGHVLSAQVDSVIKSNLLPSSMPYKRLLKYFFSHLPSAELDEAFDYKELFTGTAENKNRGHAMRIFSELSSANVLPPLESIVPVEREITMQLIESAAREHFQRLGFVSLHVPFLVPSSTNSSAFAAEGGKKKPVSLIDQSGLVVDLPHLSLTRNFARFVSKNRQDINYLKRFDIGHTYWVNAQGGQPSTEKQFCADLVCPAQDLQEFGLLSLMLEMLDAVKQVLKREGEEWSSGEMHVEIGHAQLLPKLFDLVKVPKSTRLALVSLVKEKHQFKDWKEAQQMLKDLGLPAQCIQDLRLFLPIGNAQFACSNSKTSWSNGEEWDDKPAFLDQLAKQASHEVLQECGLAEMIDFANFVHGFNIRARLVCWIMTSPPDCTGLYFRCVLRSRRPKPALHGNKKHLAVNNQYEYGHEFVAADCGRFDGLIRNNNSNSLIGIGLRLYVERIARLHSPPNTPERFLIRPLIRICSPVEKDAAKFEDEERYRVAVRLRQDLPPGVGVEWIHPKSLSFEALFSLTRELGARVMISKALTVVGGEEWRVRAVSFTAELHTLGNFSDKRISTWDELVKTVTQLVKL